MRGPRLANSPFTSLRAWLLPCSCHWEQTQWPGDAHRCHYCNQVTETRCAEPGFHLITCSGCVIHQVWSHPIDSMPFPFSERPPNIMGAAAPSPGVQSLLNLNSNSKKKEGGAA